MNVAQILSEPLIAHGIMNAEEAHTEAARLLQRVDLPVEHLELSPRILRRPTPAHRHRPCPLAQAGYDRLRRGGIGPRCLGAGAGDQSAQRFAAGIRHELYLHHPRLAWWWRTSATAWRCTSAKSSRSAPLWRFITTPSTPTPKPSSRRFRRMSLGKSASALSCRATYPVPSTPRQPPACPNVFQSTPPPPSPAIPSPYKVEPGHFVRAADLDTLVKLAAQGATAWA